MTRFRASRVFRLSLWKPFWPVWRQGETNRVPCSLHEGWRLSRQSRTRREEVLGGWTAADGGKARVREHGGWPRRIFSLARARPLAAKHLSSLSSRSSGNMPVSSDMRSGPVKRGGIVGPCCEFKEGSSWTTPSTRKECGWAMVLEEADGSQTGKTGQSSCHNAKLTRL